MKHRQGRYDEAELLLRRALFIQESRLDSAHPFVAEMRETTAVFYATAGKYPEAFEQFNESLRSRQRFVHYIFSTSSEGVFSLRRSFQHAGVKSILMSPWTIADRQASELLQGSSNFGSKVCRSVMHSGKLPSASCRKHESKEGLLIRCSGGLCPDR